MGWRTWRLTQDTRVLKRGRVVDVTVAAKAVVSGMAVEEEIFPMSSVCHTSIVRCQPYPGSAVHGLAGQARQHHARAHLDVVPQLAELQLHAKFGSSLPLF